MWLNEKHIEGLDYKNLWVTTVKYLSGHRKHRYELVDEQKEFLGVLNCCKLEIVFKCQTRLSNSFRYKDPIPKDLISGAVHKFQCGLCSESYYGESIRHLDISSGEHIGVSTLTIK